MLPRYPRAPTKPPKSPVALPPEAVPAWVHPRGRAYLKQRGLTEEESECYDLHFCDGGAWSDRLIIPMYINDTLVAFQGRDVAGIDPNRYRTEGPRPLYCPPWPRHETITPLVIVEGPFDAYAILRHFPAVAVLGIAPSTTQITALIQLIVDKHISTAHIWFDAGATGEACALQMKLLPHIPTVVIVDDHRKDPGEYLCLDDTENAGLLISQQITQLRNLLPFSIQNTP